MNDCLAALDRIASQEIPAVLVTVAAAEGSTPREPGAKMLVTADAQYDTIGGGHLEWRAAETARAMLAEGQPHREERIVLGASLGQCCGGVVQLAFELLASGEAARALHQRWAGRLAEQQRPVFLFGAGHVGAALVRALSPLPCRVVWMDERDAMFPSDVPANVQVEATDTPEAVIAAAPAGATYLVMTHSHALDLRLCEAILRRADALWFGVIGSHTKRELFARRLRERGLESDRMVCPIGVPGITGKQPAVIAAAVCAQLLQVWEAATHEQPLNRN